MRNWKRRGDRQRKNLTKKQEEETERRRRRRYYTYWTIWLWQTLVQSVRARSSFHSFFKKKKKVSSASFFLFILVFPSKQWLCVRLSFIQQQSSSKRNELVVRFSNSGHIVHQVVRKYTATTLPSQTKQIQIIFFSFGESNHFFFFIVRTRESVISEVYDLNESWRLRRIFWQPAKETTFFKAKNYTIQIWHFCCCHYQFMGQ